MNTNDDLLIDVIGDSGPFSRLGKSIGYRIKAGESEFLFDCGAPVFQLLGPEGLSKIEGIIITHSHEDHKRWLTDIALFQKFSSSTEHKIPLYCSYKILNELRNTCAYALEQTLSSDSKRITNFTFSDYFDPHLIGPQPRYRCKKLNEKDGEENWAVVDRDGNQLPPDRARVFKLPEIHRPRMLFKDPREDIWVEPESFYPYTDERFYVNSGDSPEFIHEKSGLSFSPIKSTAWHGPVVNSYLFEYKDNRTFFSSDTYYNSDLWKQLINPVKPKKNLETGAEKGETFLRQDINDYLEQVWSRERLNRGLKFYEGEYPLIHDVSGPWAKVHTNYKHLEDYSGEILLTHSPDEFTSIHPLAHLQKTFIVRGNQFYEKTDGDLFSLEATCFHKHFNRYYLGFEEDGGEHLLIKEKPGVYDVFHESETIPDKAEIIKKIKLYEDINGDYFPVLSSENEEYIVRPDGRVEHQIHTETGTKGKIVKGQRKRPSSPER